MLSGCLTKDILTNIFVFMNHKLSELAKSKAYASLRSKNIVFLLQTSETLTNRQILYEKAV